MKKLGLVVIGLGVIFVSLFYLYQQFVSKVEDPRQVIKEYYWDDTSGIRMYPDHDTFLVESLGQYLLLMVYLDDQKAFDEAYTIIDDLYREDDFIKWRLKDTSADAVVDTYRISEALFKATEVFDDASYASMGLSFLRTIKMHHQKQGIISDFYDWAYQLPGDTMHLSYQNVPMLRTLDLDLTVTKQLFNQAEEKPFFKEVYIISQSSLHVTNELTVNLIDQLLTAISYVDLFQETPATFHEWLMNQLAENNRLTGLYYRDTLEEAVDYEASAVNSLALIYFNKTEEKTYEKLMYEKVIEQLQNHEKNDYQDVHAFDFLYLHLAIEIYQANQ